MTTLRDVNVAGLVESPARIAVSRCHLDALTCPHGSAPDGHRGLWGVPADVAARERIEPGRRVEFVVWDSDVVAAGVVTRVISAVEAYARIGGKPCSGVNDFWFTWEDAA